MTMCMTWNSTQRPNVADRQANRDDTTKTPIQDISQPRIRTYWNLENNSMGQRMTQSKPQKPYNTKRFLSLSLILSTRTLKLQVPLSHASPLLDQISKFMVPFTNSQSMWKTMKNQPSQRWSPLRDHRSGERNHIRVINEHDNSYTSIHAKPV